MTASYDIGKHQIRTTYPNIGFEDMIDSASLHNSREPFFIHLGGVSAVGKSTVSQDLVNNLPEAQVLSIDSYLIAGLGQLAVKFDDTPPNPNQPYIGGISPKVWDLDLLLTHLRDLKNNQAVQVPIFDQTIKDRIGFTELEPSKFIVVEGGHSFSDTFRNLANYKLLLTASLHDRLTRKLIRTFAKFHRTDIDDIIERYLTKDEPVWKHYQEEHEGIADQIVQNPSIPEIHYTGFPAVIKPKPLNKLFELIPLPETGELHNGEVFYIGFDDDAVCHIGYSINGRDIVRLPLEKKLINLLNAHYTLNEITQ